MHELKADLEIYLKFNSNHMIEILKKNFGMLEKH